MRRTTIKTWRKMRNGGQEDMRSKEEEDNEENKVDGKDKELRKTTLRTKR